ncbi:MAG TPA: hypothetical protein PLU35_11790 [Phycisphaerales bacterium]|nr:hypothetical protein [Phycisphaerales bacterium]
MSAIRDPDVAMLAALSGTLAADYATPDDPWAGSPFAWIKQQQSRRRGKIGEQLLSGFLAAKGLDVARSPDQEADRLVNGLRVEVKFSTLWESGIYKFQQIRDQNYAMLVCLGVSPFNAHCWVIPKPLLKQHVIGRLGQHTGRRGTDTAWMSFAPGQPYPWMKPCGGRLRDAVAILRRCSK